MEKKLLLNKQIKSVQPYIPIQFEEDFLKGDTTTKKEKKEEDIQKTIKVLQDEGYEKGHALGYAKGLKVAEKEIEERAEKLSEIIKKFQGYKEEKIKELLPQIIDLSLEIAKKVIHKEVDLDKNIVMHVAQDAIKRVQYNEDKIIIKVNHLDYEQMTANSNLLKDLSGVKDITIEPASSVSPGGCYIETQTGEIDARIEEQVEEIKNASSAAIARANNREV